MKVYKILLTIFIALFALCGQVNAETLLWQNGDPDPVDGYKLYWGIVNPPDTEIDVGNVIEYDLTPLNLQLDIAYYFRVKAYRGANDSAWSDTLQFTKQADGQLIIVPAKPTTIIIQLE